MHDPEPLSFCPVQLWTVAFDGNRFRGEILPELERLKESGTVRIVDLLVVRKDRSGAIAVLTASDLDWEEATRYGTYIGTMIGLGAGGEEGADRGALAGAAELADGHVFGEQDVERLTAALPNGSAAALVLLEHIWSRGLLDAVERANGVEVENQWLGPEELVRIGFAVASETAGD